MGEGWPNLVSSFRGGVGILKSRRLVWGTIALGIELDWGGLEHGGGYGGRDGEGGVGVGHVVLLMRV